MIKIKINLIKASFIKIFIISLTNIVELRFSRFSFN